MTILPRSTVRAAVERALQMDPDRDAAVRAAAQALGIDEAVVREAIEGADHQTIRRAA